VLFFLAFWLLILLLEYPEPIEYGTYEIYAVLDPKQWLANCTRFCSFYLKFICSKLRDRKLELVNLSGNTLEHVASSLIAEAATNSKQLDVSLTNLRPDQILGKMKDE
jgi:hypothetical protein